MNELYEGITQLSKQSIGEWVAVALSIAYLALAIRKSMWCWPCAFVSTAILSWLFFDVKLPMEAALNIYYMVMAVYGFYLWKNASQASNNQAIKNITTRPVLWHMLTIGGIICASLISGHLLSNNTDAAMPYLDSFTTWGAVVTTYMVAKKVFENWYYWLVVDSAALYLYLSRELYGVALLMALYLVLVLIGIVTWKKELHRQPETPYGLS